MRWTERSISAKLAKGKNLTDGVTEMTRLHTSDDGEEPKSESFPGVGTMIRNLVLSVASI